MPRPKKHKEHMVQKRFSIRPSTNVLIGVMAALAPGNPTKRDVVEAALLYGIAYMNDIYKIEVNKWMGQVKLPTLKEVEEIVDFHGS